MQLVTAGAAWPRGLRVAVSVTAAGGRINFERPTAVRRCAKASASTECSASRVSRGATFTSGRGSRGTGRGRIILLTIRPSLCKTKLLVTSHF